MTRLTGRTVANEQVREGHTFAWVEALLQDLRQAARSYRRSSLPAYRAARVDPLVALRGE